MATQMTTGNMGPQFTPTTWYAQYYQQLTPAEIANLRSWFEAIDRDRSGTLEVAELQNVTFDGRPLGFEAALKLVKVFDKDRNGRVDFYEYASMHKFITRVRQAFLIADSDRSGRIEAREIYTALLTSGLNFLTVNSISELMLKFNKTGLGLSWEEFLMLAAHVAHCRSIFEWNDKDNDGWITINLDQLIQLSSYLS
jgi:Ca2+-binding EF-hand superfamily protein